MLLDSSSGARLNVAGCIRKSITGAAELAQLLQAVLRVDVQQLVSSAHSHELPALIAQFRSLSGAAAEQAARVVTGPTSDWDKGAFGSPFACVITCFEFCAASDLSRARSVSREWRVWSEGDALWQPLTESRWPGNKDLRRAGVTGSAMELYLRRCKLLRGPDLSIVCSESTAASDYGLLVEMNGARGPIFNQVLELLTIDGELGFGCVYANFPADFISSGQHSQSAIAPTEFNLVRLSLAILRKSDCKLLRICCGRPLGDADEWDDEDADEDTVSYMIWVDVEGGGTNGLQRAIDINPRDAKIVLTAEELRSKRVLPLDISIICDEHPGVALSGSFFTAWRSYEWL